MKILTVKEVGDLLQVKPSTIYSWAEQKLIPSLKINGVVRFDEADIRDWISRCKKDGECYNNPIQARSSIKGGRR
jgi:excisionase family DNA binding protein